MIIMTSPKDMLKILLLMVASFCLGRVMYKEIADSCIVKVERLEKDNKLLEENLKYCWNDLPSSHIRHGSIDY